MITTSPAAAASLRPFQPHLNSSGTMDTKPHPHIMPITALHPPQFFITGGGYTIIPSVSPMHATAENFPPPATALHPIGQFAGGRPLPAGLHTYYSPSDMYQVRQTPSPSPLTVHSADSKRSNPQSNPQSESKRIHLSSSNPPPLPTPPPGGSRICSPGLGEMPKRAASGEDAREGAEVKREPLAEEGQCGGSCRGGNSMSGGVSGVIAGNTRVENGSYSLNALIDVPASHSSRTSSLSSSLSSFRFGGSLSHLWASQLSLSKVNMKSTG